MNANQPDPLATLLLDLLPEDGTAIGNGSLYELVKKAARKAGVSCREPLFDAARESLLAAGKILKGKGRGGATRRVLGVADAPPRASGPTFALEAQVQPEQLPFDGRGAVRSALRKSAQTASGDPQVLSYRHPDRRVNNPEVGLVNAQSDPEQPKTRWAYDPHLDPVLQWTGKTERTSFEIDTVSLHVHERVDPMSILAAVSKGKASRERKGGGIQPGLFEAPFESLPLRDAVDFYRHDKGWSNRLIAGDSLLVMNSLLVKEGMAGQVQMIYIDPPYGIKYGSNFQPFVNKRDVKDRADADLTQEPEMIKAFRDTWELGIHSYLTYLRDRLLLAKELLSESGSVFVQISEENLHLVRNICQEVFGELNFVSVVTFVKTSAQESESLSNVCDYLVWYARDKSKLKYRKMWLGKL